MIPGTGHKREKGNRQNSYHIDMKYWKVVMRKGAHVYTMDAEQLKLGKSRHEAFKQLLNLEEFTEGIS